MSYHFRDPIHGMIEVSDNEAELINDPFFQRLRYIRQLGTSYLVYHGAEHTRFGHSIGVMHLVSKAMESLYKRGYLTGLTEDEFKRVRQIGRIVGLLHDIGHGPFSHVGENSGLYPEMMDFNKEKKCGHEVYTRLIVRDYFGEQIDRLFKDDGITKEDILSFMSGWVFDKKFFFVKDLIDGQLDADKMDYLLRDSYYCGVQYGKYDLHRILDTLCICHPDDNPDNEWQLGIESNGVHAVEELIFARYWMFIQVYFHKTRRIYDKYLSNFIKEILKEYSDGFYPVELNEYLKWNDNRIMQYVEKSAKIKNSPAENLYFRKHLKEAFLSLPLQEKNKDEHKNELGRIAWVIEQVEDTFSTEIEKGLVYIDQAKTSTSKYLIEIPQYIEETDADEHAPLFAIPVLDKHTKKCNSIQDYSLHIKNVTGMKLNVLRVYADSSILNKVSEFCNKNYYDKYPQYIEEMKRKREKLNKLKAEIEEDDKKNKNRIDRFS